MKKAKKKKTEKGIPNIQLSYVREGKKIMATVVQHLTFPLSFNLVRTHIVTLYYVKVSIKTRFRKVNLPVERLTNNCRQHTQVFI